MKMPALYLLVLVLAGTLLGSCTSQLYIDSVRPADVAISTEQWKVVAINRFNPTLLPFDKERKVAVVAEGARQAFSGALEAIVQDSTYLLVYNDSASYKRQAPEESLAGEQLQALYERHPFHLLLSLENFETFFTQETVREKHEDGSVSKTAYYTLVSRTYWALYDSTGSLLDKVALEQQEPYQSRSVISGLLAVGPSLANAGPVVNKLAWHTGARYWQRLYPQPISYMRPYYSAKKLQPAAAHMAAANWSQAIALLRPMAEGSSRDGARAAYNLAVIYEAMGMLEEARHWAQVARSRNNRLALLLY